MFLTYFLLALAFPVIVVVMGLLFGRALARPVDSPAASRAADSAARIAANRDKVERGRFDEVVFATELRGYDPKVVDRIIAAAAKGQTVAVDGIEVVRGGYRFDEVDDVLAALASDEAVSASPVDADDAGNDGGDSFADDGASGTDRTDAQRLASASQRETLAAAVKKD